MDIKLRMFQRQASNKALYVYGYWLAVRRICSTGRQMLTHMLSCKEG